MPAIPFAAERSCDGHDADYSYRRNVRQRRGSEICNQSREKTAGLGPVRP
jgi:hypothetical protein